MNNQKYMVELLRDVGARVPKFRLGQEVIDRRYGYRGLIDKMYANFASVLDARSVPRNWYEIQEKPPRTPKSGFWYGVVLVDGAVLVGEDDLDAVQ